MEKTPSHPKTPTLDEALAAATRAAKRVEQWPAWMLELSPSTASLSRGSTGEFSKKS